jgi:hypothetical protein
MISTNSDYSVAGVLRTAVIAVRYLLTAEINL